MQVYLRAVQPRLLRPEKELKAFAKVLLQPGERRRVEIKLEAEALAYYNDRLQSWATDAGAYEVLVGSSSRHIHLRGAFELAAIEAAAGSPHAPFNTASPIGTLLDHPAARAVLQKHIPEMLAAPELSLAKAMSLEQVAPFTQGLLSEEMLARINEDLAKV